MYVVVVVGDTTTEVPVTVPMPLSIESVGVGLPETVQESVVDWPDRMFAGTAPKEEMTGAVPCDPGRTVTGTAKASPFSFAAMVTVLVVADEYVEIGNVPEVAPEGTVTDAGADAAPELELERAITVPPAGAAMVSVTVPVVDVPADTVVGEINNAESSGVVRPLVPLTKRTAEGCVID